MKLKPLSYIFKMSFIRINSGISMLSSGL